MILIPIIGIIWFILVLSLLVRARITKQNKYKEIKDELTNLEKDLYWEYQIIPDRLK